MGRFGYNGVFWSQNESSYFFISGLIYFYYNFIILNNEKYMLKFFIFLFASFIVGTKAVFAFLILLTLFHFNFYFKKFYTSIIISFAMIAGGIGLFTLWKMGYFAKLVFLYEKYGVVNMLLSGRNNYVKPKFIDYISNNWNFWNYLIGGNLIDNVVELELLDLILNFGFLGSVIYILFYYKTVINFNFKFNKIFKLFLIFSLFLIMSLSGHFFHSAINALYLFLLILYIKYNDESHGKSRYITSSL
jgi:hypothetical protein